MYLDLPILQYQSFHSKTKSSLNFPITLIIIIVPPHLNKSMILQLLLILTFVTIAQGKGGGGRGGGKGGKGGKGKPKKPADVLKCLYKIPAGYADNLAATKSRYTVTVTSGSVISTPTYDGSCFLDNPPKECARDTDRCRGACIVEHITGDESAAQKGMTSSLLLVAFVGVSDYLAVWFYGYFELKLK
ncbi:1eee2558-3313-4f3f-aff9-f1e3398b03d8 [Sclerotinia trifoliorum]|uniref:1eee2558-3313-4f3f-aff9-f1e3398b03d8 n=1 Tax=Sclerotinia trifoliorum TaxID=28548 RepID=A0A8H2ZMS9_9HELO|nr:1eee2558-3313-4f3f-aff9-f1e3398b03d8 [Sclerotinia trifoliorum]